MESGFLLIDKPKGITSHDVIYELRKITEVKRIGHAGTLDPNATGLLIVGVGRESTKKLGDLSKNTKKEYIAEIFLGETRSTDDAEGMPYFAKASQGDKLGIKILPSLSKMKSILSGFVGESEQVPPIYSAIKIKGKKAYQLARAGKEIKMKPRKITIYSIKVLKYKYPKLEIKCDVSSGTYIRALARDIGEKLGSGAYLLNLRRTKIGDFKIESAVELNELKADNWREFLIQI
jgi:tRNA pseudouridine55 synthase